MTSPVEPAAPPEETPKPRGTGRKAASKAGRIALSTCSAVLITLTCILVPVSLITVWVHDLVLDTDQYVETMEPLATDPAIQDAAVNRISQAVDVRVDGNAVTSDISAWLLAQGLPPRVGEAIKALGPQVDSAVDQTVNKAATRFVHGEAFPAIWTGANEAAHSAVVHVLTGKGRGAVNVKDGTVTLDVGTAVDRVRQELVDSGVSVAENIPDSDKQLVLVKSDKFGKIQDAAHAFDVIGNWILPLTALLGAAGVFLARRRRRALVTTAIGAAAASLVVAIALLVARDYYLDHLPATVQSPAAAEAVFDTLLRFLRLSLRTAIVLGIVVALGAYLSGPGRLPRAIRGWAERTADSIAAWAGGHGIRTSRAAMWTNTHRHALTIGVVALVTVLFALWNRPSALVILLLVIILLVLLAAIALLAANARAGKPPQQADTH